MTISERLKEVAERVEGEKQNIASALLQLDDLYRQIEELSYQAGEAQSELSSARAHIDTAVSISSKI